MLLGESSLPRNKKDSIKKNENLSDSRRKNTNDYKNLNKSLKQPIKNFINLSKTYKNTRNINNSNLYVQEDTQDIKQNKSMLNYISPNVGSPKKKFHEIDHLNNTFQSIYENTFSKKQDTYSKKNKNLDTFAKNLNEMNLHNTSDKSVLNQNTNFSNKETPNICDKLFDKNQSKYNSNKSKHQGKILFKESLTKNLPSCTDPYTDLLNNKHLNQKEQDLIKKVDCNVKEFMKNELISK